MGRPSLTWAGAAALAVLVLVGQPFAVGPHWQWRGAGVASAQAAASVEGFRSARFGMTEDQVRTALIKDFDMAEDDIGRSVNAVEKTTSLVVNVDDIIPDSGRAVVGYIFGYESKRLIQVNIIWGGDDTQVMAANLVATANILRRYFLEQGFPTDTLITNAPLEGGSVLVFRGIDEQGRVALLQLNVQQGQSTEDEGATTEESVSLHLNYISDPENPDIFQIESGAF